MVAKLSVSVDVFVAGGAARAPRHMVMGCSVEKVVLLV
jgi:hypothetical protein